MTITTSPTYLLSAADAPATAPGHRLLAQLGVTVLRPGGDALTATLLRHAGLREADVVELAPGRGRTAQRILDHYPRSYLGVEQDLGAAADVNGVLDGMGRCLVGDASAVPLAAATADVVVCEALLTMQSPRRKSAILAEACRVLRPGGRLALHELAMTPDTLSDYAQRDVSAILSRTMRVNARPLTTADWLDTVRAHGMHVEYVSRSPLVLLDPLRLMTQEGPAHALRFGWNVLRDPATTARVSSMYTTFGELRRELLAVAVVAVKNG